MTGYDNDRDDVKAPDAHEEEHSCLIRAEMSSSQHSGAEIIIRHVWRHKIAASVRGVSPKAGEDVTIRLSNSQSARGQVITARENHFVVELETELQIEALGDLAQHKMEFLRDEGRFELITRGRILPQTFDPKRTHLV